MMTLMSFGGLRPAVIARGSMTVLFVVRFIRIEGSELVVPASARTNGERTRRTISRSSPRKRGPRAAQRSSALPLHRPQAKLIEQRHVAVAAGVRRRQELWP